MLFAIGTRVKFKHTGETGVITAQLADGMLSIRLDSDADLVIPAFEEDLFRDTSSEPVTGIGRFLTAQTEKKNEYLPEREIKISYPILHPQGVQLVFEPMPGRDSTVTRYKSWLINDTTQEFLFECDVYTTKRDIFSRDGKLGVLTALEMGDLLADDLNDAATIWLHLRRLTTAGPDLPMERTVKIKAKQFFNQLCLAPVLNLPAHQFVLFDKFEAPQADTQRDLLEYTKQKTREVKSFSPNSVPHQTYNVEDFANFNPEIDLHIEKLVSVNKKMDNAAILGIQMQHFRKHLEQAVRLGIPRIYVIHGKGKGKLRDEIAYFLRENKHVVQFKNEYHPRYGHGATEIILAD